MKISRFKYYFREASRNVFSNGWMSLASIFTVIACLLVFGLFMVLSVNMNYIAQQLEGDYEILLVIDENTPQDQVTALGERILQVQNVAEVELSSKDERLADLKEDFGADAAILDGYESDNPLRDRYRVRLVDLTQSEQTVQELETLPGVVKIIRNEATIHKLTSMTSFLGHISIWVMVALVVISVFIISNTIKLTVFARRKEINIMKYVGATDWFIRWPFIIEGVMIGVTGSLLALVLVLFGYNGIVSLLSSLEIMFLRFKPLHQLLLMLISTFLGMGILLGGLGSLISVRKHLKV